MKKGQLLKLPRLPLLTHLQPAQLKLDQRVQEPGKKRRNCCSLEEDHSASVVTRTTPIRLVTLDTLKEILPAALRGESELPGNDAVTCRRDLM